MAQNTDTQNLEDLEVLLQGVSQVWLGGVPGSLIVFGPSGFPIVSGSVNQSQKIFHAILAGGRYGKGKIIAAPHDSFIQHEIPGPADIDKFIMNSINWLAGNKKSIRVGHFKPLRSGFPSVLEQNGVEAVPLKWQDLTTTNLTPYDVLIISQNFTAEKVPALASFMENGGGVLIAVTAWACRCSVEHPGTEYAPNLLAQRAGIAWTKNHYYTYPKTPEKIYDVSLEQLRFVHLRKAFDHLTEVVLKYDFGQEKLEQCMQIVTEAFSVNLGEDILSGLNWKDLVKVCQPNMVSSTNKPSPKDKIRHKLFHVLCNVQNPEDITAHPFSKIFPGELTNNSPTETTIELQMSNNFSRWNSTGLYAPAGVVIEVRFEHMDLLKNYEVQIGCHTDDLSNHEVYKRLPNVTLRKPVVHNRSRIASPYGGLIYIILPEETKSRRLQVFISGAIRAPYFKLGETNPSTWKVTHRFHPAPWAELATDKIIITVPTTVATNIENPTEVLEFWDQVLDACADLAGKSRDRPSPERFVADIAISSGYLHSGYPIMSHLDLASLCTDVKKLRTEGSWGHFHELGHNHQKDAWTFDGTVETTCNIFTLYIYSTVLNKSSSEARIESKDLSPEVYVPLIQKYIANGKNFDYWKSNPFFSLLFYIQLQQEYGWYVFKSIFKKYENMSESQLPKSNEDEMDMWLIMFSEEVGKNLYSFFESWGIPISQDARARLAKKELQDSGLRIDNMLIH